jgi:D-glycero-alpha-D-manno-heptose-7-phosphate kinase
MIISKTPFRISFFGGGTDYPDWVREHGGKVLGTSIDKYCYISCRRLPPFFDHKYRVVYSKIENVNDHQDIQHPAVKAVLGYLNISDGLEIHHDGDLPARSGLGSSSAFTVGLLNSINALQGSYSSSQQLASEAIHVEQEVIGECVGSQDQVLTACGGFNRVDFYTDGQFGVTPVVMNAQRQELLNDHMLLFFTGISRFASEVAKSKVENLAAKALNITRIGEMVDEGLNILSSATISLDEFGRLLHESWQLKRDISTRISNDAIDAIYDKALSSGAIGGKLLGAGGGGFILFFAPPERHASIVNTLSDLIHVPFRFENSGSKIVLYQPDGLN